jgi:hypothetical protein
MTLYRGGSLLSSPISLPSVTIKNMTLDFTKTATPCELIAALIPALNQHLWKRGRLWHGRNIYGTWEFLYCHGRHIQLLEEAIHALPDSPRFHRAKQLSRSINFQNQTLRGLKAAMEGGYLPRPHDYPHNFDTVTFWPRSCLCGQDCWKSSHLSEPAVDLPASSENLTIV